MSQISYQDKSEIQEQDFKAKELKCLQSEEYYQTWGIQINMCMGISDQFLDFKIY